MIVMMMMMMMVNSICLYGLWVIFILIDQAGDVSP